MNWFIGRGESIFLMYPRNNNGPVHDKLFLPGRIRQVALYQWMQSTATSYLSTAWFSISQMYFQTQMQMKYALWLEKRNQFTWMPSSSLLMHQKLSASIFCSTSVERLETSKFSKSSSEIKRRQECQLDVGDKQKI